MFKYKHEKRKSTNGFWKVFLYTCLLTIQSQLACRLAAAVLVDVDLKNVSVRHANVIWSVLLIYSHSVKMEPQSVQVQILQQEQLLNMNEINIIL